LTPRRRGRRGGDGWTLLRREDLAADLVELLGGHAVLERRALDQVPVRREVLPLRARLVAAGVPIRDAARAAVTGPLTDDRAVTDGLGELVDTYLPMP
jgi:nitric oxide reductase NorQ protein